MNPTLFVSVGLLVIAQLLLPRRYAFAPLLFATFNIGNVELFSEFSAARIIIFFGVLRGIFSGQLVFTARDKIDRLFMIFGFFALLSSVGHNSDNGNPFLFRAGLCYNVIGSYLCGKCFLQGEDALERFTLVTFVSIVPLAILLFAEFITGQNSYHPHLGGRGALAQYRDGFRARGPFAHAILSGTSGAVSIALFVRLWLTNKKLATMGVAACLAIVIASSSSGPIAASMFSCGLLFAWRWRQYLKHAKKTVMLVIFALSLYMDRPFYYIVSSIDLTGGSTGWHRAKLIESSIKYIGEWWLFGSDYTRHWMPTGVSWSPNHSDLTNYYLHLGVIGGFTLTFCLISIIWIAGKKLINISLAYDFLGNRKIAISYWALFSVLIAHAASFVSISYFDQMYVLFYLLIGLIASLNFPDVSQRARISEEYQNTGNKLEESRSSFFHS